MNSLYVIEGDGGGAVSHVLTLATRLVGTKMCPLVAFLCDGPSVETARRCGVPFYLLKKTFPLDVRPVWELIGILNRHHINIIHSHTIRGNFYARVSAGLSRMPVVVLTTVHSHIVDELKGKDSYGLWDGLLWFRERCLWPFVDHFICVSHELKQRLLSNGIQGCRISVIENGVELPDLKGVSKWNREVREELGIGQTQCVVTTVGRLVPVKNHMFFLRAAKRIVQQDDRITFLIVGDGPLYEPLRQRAVQWGLEGHVVFTGWRNDIARLLCATNIYTICSFVEGLNLSVLEAMAYGIPVVGTNVKGIANVVIDGKTGRLVPLDDVESMVHAIMSLVADRTLAAKMGSNGRQRIEKKYSVRAMTNATQSLYSTLVNRKKIRGMVSHGEK